MDRTRKRDTECKRWWDEVGFKYEREKENRQETVRDCWE